MGDRAQVAIKQHDDSRVYLYGHWTGAGVYQAIQSALNGDHGRADDSEYFARIVFDQMIGDQHGEATGFGISTSAHGDIEHAIPVLDCDAQTITFEPVGCGGETFPESMTFKEFAGCDLAEYVAHLRD